MDSVVAPISRENFSEKIKLIEKELFDLNLSKSEVMTAELLIEETFLRFEKAEANNENFSASVAVKKHAGSLGVVVSVKAQEFNPLNNLSENSVEDDEYWNSYVLKAYTNKLKYSRKNDENIVTIKIRESSNKTVRNTLAGLILGLIVGFFLKTFVSFETNAWIIENIINSLQTMFVNALVMLVAPMIFFTIMDGIIGVSDTAIYIERLGKRLVILSLLKLAFYVGLGLLAGFMIGEIPEISLMSKESVFSQQSSSVSIRDFIVRIIPSNAISPFNENNVLQLLFLACFFGVILSRSSDYVAWAKDGIKFMSLFTIDVISTVSLVIPFLVVVSVIELIIEVGFQGIYSYIKIIFTSACCLFVSFAVSSIIVFVVGKILPTPFFKKITRFSVLPFSLSSSNACLPFTLSFCSKTLGMDEKITKFSIPVGMQLNMDGTAFYISVISMILVRTFEININVELLFSLFLLNFLMSLTGIGLIAMPTILSTLGIPQAAVLHFISIEPILDMFGTAQSVIGNITSSFVVSRLENKVDENLYYS